WALVSKTHKKNVCRGVNATLAINVIHIQEHVLLELNLADEQISETSNLEEQPTGTEKGNGPMTEVQLKKVEDKEVDDKEEKSKDEDTPMVESSLAKHVKKLSFTTNIVEKFLITGEGLKQQQLEYDRVKAKAIKAKKL
nr:hypothetical protein [Tanacetum cinerariifolium]